MTDKDVLKLLAKGGGSTLECKKAEGGIPNSLFETYSAFANTNGGIILLGVQENMTERERSKHFTIVGIKNADKMCNDLWKIFHSQEKVNINLLKNEDIEIIKLEDKNIIAIKVPRADCNMRPIYINNNMSHGTLMRNNDGDFHCSERIIKMMVRDSYEDGNDRLFLEYYTMDDIDIPSLEKYRIQFRIDNNGHVWNTLNHKDFLTQLGGYTINKEEGKEGLTMAGLLMFGKGFPVREHFDTIRMDYIDKSNLIGDQRYSDRLTYDGTWENNLYNFISMVIPRITRDLPRPFHMEGIIRQDDTLQHKAVREAFINMIIHADFMMNGLLRVEKYDDRLEFTNPGLLKLPLDKIYAGGESKARNIRIQKMLRMIGFGENIGSGFPLILRAWDEKKWSKPELIEERELMQVKLVLNMNITKEIGKNIGKELSERQKVILGYIKENKTITILEMSQKAQVTTRTIERTLNELVKRGILLREGGRKKGFWVLHGE